MIEEQGRRGHEGEFGGPLHDEEMPCLAVEGEADEGILFCWTGTGVSIAANKVPGIRAALCQDAETARGARLWNRANVLCLSLRAVSPVIATEILDAWFGTPPGTDPTDVACVQQVAEIERQYC